MISSIKIDAWTLDTSNTLAVANAAPLLQAGVDLFTTNTPLALKQLLETAAPGQGAPVRA